MLFAFWNQISAFWNQILIFAKFRLFERSGRWSSHWSAVFGVSIAYNPMFWSGLFSFARPDGGKTFCARLWRSVRKVLGLLES